MDMKNIEKITKVYFGYKMHKEVRKRIEEKTLTKYNRDLSADP
jgi:hypothetical protein